MSLLTQAWVSRVTESDAPDITVIGCPMNPVLAEVLNPAGYDELPESIKHLYTPHQYAWLSDAEKARLVERETEPEVD